MTGWIAMDGTSLERRRSPDLIAWCHIWSGLRVEIHSALSHVLTLGVWKFKRRGGLRLPRAWGDIIPEFPSALSWPHFGPVQVQVPGGPVTEVP